jgi:hypothetical protein
MASPLVSELALLLVRINDEVPEPEDVKAGWAAFAIFILLIVAVGVLGFSLTKHLRRAQANEEAGLFGSDDEPAAPGEPEKHEAP